jgi:hypothetical protein
MGIPARHDKAEDHIASGLQAVLMSMDQQCKELGTAVTCVLTCGNRRHRSM